MALCGVVNAQNNEKFLGTWDFDTETGEIGYESGIMEITKESVKTTFTDISYEYPSTSFSIEGDTLKFNMNVDGTPVECWLVVKDASKLTGYATWESGETMLILTRKKD